MIKAAGHPDIFELKRFAHLLHASYVPHATHLPPAAIPDFHKEIEKHRLFIARLHTIKGYMVCYPEHHAYHIDAITVSDNHKDRHIARQMLVFAESQALQHDCTQLALWNDAAMRRHIEFYKSQGFHEVMKQEEHGHERVYFEM